MIGFLTSFWASRGTAIGTPTKTGSTNATNRGSSFAVTGGTTGHRSIVLLSPKSNSATISALTDSARNAYRKVIAIAGTPSFEVWWCANATAPTTITATTSTGQYAAVALDVSGLSSGGTDVALSGTFSSALTFSKATGTLAHAAELIIAWWGRTSTAMGTITPATGFTAITTPSTFYGAEYDIVSVTTSLTVAPTWGTSTSGSYVLCSFHQ